MLYNKHSNSETNTGQINEACEPVGHEFDMLAPQPWSQKDIKYDIKYW